MPTRIYKIAGTVIRLESEEPIAENGNFKKFLVPPEKAELTAVIRRVDSLPEERGRLIFESGRRCAFSDGAVRYSYTSYFDPELMDRKRFAVRIDCGEKCELLIENSSGLWESMVFDALDLPGELLSRGTAVMHCSFIIYNGEAILFSADSGVGKSTQAELWRVCRGARVINGDRAALRVKNGVLFACGLPYCGTSKISEAAEAPVGAIILLSQGRKNELRRADTANAFRELIGKLSYNTSLSESAEKAADLALAAAQQRVYYYSCRADESAVARLEEEICRNNSGR